jgi:hypothetical protein
MPDRLSHKALGITEGEYLAVIEVRELFASNKLIFDDGDSPKQQNGFNMNVIVDQDECGTTCCIGGWMFLIMTRDRTTTSTKASHYVQQERSRPLYPLFFPFTDVNRRDLHDDNGQAWDFPYELIPPAYALAAIDNFLATGDPDWPSVCDIRNLEVRDDA